MDFHVCRICFKALPISDFHKCKHRKRGHTNECKVCKNNIDCVRYFKKRKNLSDDQKIAEVFLQKRMNTKSEGFDILYNRVMTRINSIPDNKWELFLNQLLYKYNAFPSASNCNSLLRDKQN